MTDWIFTLFDSLGAVGVGLLILLDNFFPPLPSELILPLAGYRASVGAINPVLVWPMATLGSVIGAAVIYGLGAWLGYERLHELAGKRWFIVFGQRDLERGHAMFEKHGGKMVLLGRCVPLVRSVISVPAGIVRMPLGRFLLLSTLGSGVWNALWIGLGYLMGANWPVLEQWAGAFSRVVLVVGFVFVVWLIVRKVRSVRAGGTAADGIEVPTGYLGSDTDKPTVLIPAVVPHVIDDRTVPMHPAPRGVAPMRPAPRGVR